jgi:hypothetical protein
MMVVCLDASVTGGKLAKGAVYEVCEIISDQDGDYFRLVETGPACWFVDRFRPFEDNSKFLSGADAETEGLDNRRKQEVHT